MIIDQFADLAVLPDFPNGLNEYTCHAFPGALAPVKRLRCWVGVFAAASCLFSR